MFQGKYLFEFYFSNICAILNQLRGVINGNLILILRLISTICSIFAYFNNEHKKIFK